MKRAVILHGTDGNPDINWLPWMRKQLEAKGYTVFAPLLPENHTPNRAVYSAFLRTANWDFKDNLLIGHSSGATTVLNLLAEDWFPNVEKSILVGTFLNERMLSDAGWYEKGQFDNLFPPSFDSRKIKEKSSELVFIHGYDDPYCSYDDVVDFSNKVEGRMVNVPGGRHLSSNRTELPEILSYL